MPGFHVDRATQYRQAEKKIAAQQKLNYDSKKPIHRNSKDAIITVCIIAVVIVIVLILGKL